MSFSCPNNVVNFGPLTVEICWQVWGTPANFNGFRVLPFVTAATSLTGDQPNFAQCFAVLWSVKLYIHFRGLLPPDSFGRCRIDFMSKSCILIYWQRYCMPLQQWASANLCGVVQGMELPNFCRGRHLYSAGRPSLWASAHILVCVVVHFFWLVNTCFCCVRFSFPIPSQGLGNQARLGECLRNEWDMKTELSQSISCH